MEYHNRHIAAMIAYLDFDPPTTVTVREQEKQVAVDCSRVYGNWTAEIFLDRTFMLYLGCGLLVGSVIGLFILLWRTG